MVWFILCYIVQIAIAIYALTAIPMKGELPTIYENFRKNGMVVFGFLPCFVFSLLMQGIAAAIYFSKVAAVRGAENKANAKFQASLGGSAATSSGNPFGGSSTTAPPPPPASSGNPFATGGAGSSSVQGSNPFGESSQPAPPASGDNPFSTGGSSAGSPPPSDNPFA